jgi:hypothetical protein
MALSNIVGVVVATVFCVMHASLSDYLNSVIPEPYMDEPLHAAQAQRFCAGRYDEWDDRITTFPGLYIWSSAVARLARKSTCDIPLLRMSSATLAAAVAPASFIILRQLQVQSRRQTGSIADALLAAAIGTFPIHFFASGLYYTDGGALLGALATLAAAFSLATANKGEQQASLATRLRRAALSTLLVGVCQGRGGGVCVYLLETTLNSTGVVCSAYSCRWLQQRSFYDRPMQCGCALRALLLQCGFFHALGSS